MTVINSALIPSAQSTEMIGPEEAVKEDLRVFRVEWGGVRAGRGRAEVQ